jgi:hypothetical protein
VNEHQSALQTKLDAALAEAGKAADSARAVIDGDLQVLHELGAASGRPPLIADVPVDEPPPYSAAGGAVGARADPGYAARRFGRPGLRRRRPALAELISPLRRPASCR